MGTQLPVPEIVTPSGHKQWTEWAVELETAELLFALVKASKPELVVECGTGEGVSAMFIAQALVLNEKGKLVSFESDKFWFDHAVRNLDEFDCVEVRNEESTETDLKPDLVFVDSLGTYRNEVIQFWLTRHWDPLVVIHDARRNYPAFSFGAGVYIPGHDGVWIGRPKSDGVVKHLSL